MDKRETIDMEEVTHLRHKLHCYRSSESYLGSVVTDTERLIELTALSLSGLTDVYCDDDECEGGCDDCDSLVREVIEENNSLIEEWLQEYDITHDTEHAPTGMARIKLMDRWEKE